MQLSKKNSYISNQTEADHGDEMKVLLQEFQKKKNCPITRYNHH